MTKKVIKVFMVCAATLAIGLMVFQWKYSLGCEPIGNEENMQQSIQTIRLGDPHRSDIYGARSSTDKHPAGLNFYQRNWPDRKELGEVHYDQGRYSFAVSNVLGTIGTADADNAEGITHWNISFGASPDQADAHQVARDSTIAFLAKLQDAGWQRYIDVGDPRLTGKQAWIYTEAQLGSYSLDPNYIPTMDEWMALLKWTPSWTFFADGVYIKFSVQESNMGGFVGKGTYLMDVEIKSESEFYGVGYFSGDEEKIKSWKMLLPAELKKYQALRVKRETELKAQGYSINTAYQDPPIMALEAPSGITH